MSRGTGARIGLAIGTDAVTGVLRLKRGVHVATVPAALSGADAADALGSALPALRRELESAAGTSLSAATVHVTLLPPLADVRLLQLPPLRTAEALAVLRRDAGRHFLAVPAPRVVGVRMSRRSGVPALAAAAGEALVNGVRAAVAGNGWRTASVAPAAAAWAAARSGNAHAIVAAVGDAVHVIGTTDNGVHALRRVPAQDTAELVRVAGEVHGGVPGTVLIFADGQQRDTISHALTAAGWTPVGRHASAAEVAARFANDADLELVSSGFAAERRLQETRIAARLAVAAVLMLLATAAVELWGARRDLTAVRTRRAEIRATVEPLLALRDSVDRLSTTLGDIDSIAQEIPRWTGALFDLAMLLPAETHITRLYATGDTIIIDAVGARAGNALQALRDAGTLRDVKLLGSVDRELTDGATTSERFRISARLARPRPASDARSARAEDAR